MSQFNGLFCCGAAELHDISDHPNAEDVISTIDLGQLQNKPFIVFSGVIEVDHQPYVRNLTNLIRRENMGSVTLFKPRNNPNSGNMISVALWAPDMAAVRAWREAHPTVEQYVVQYGRG